MISADRTLAIPTAKFIALSAQGEKSVGTNKRFIGFNFIR